MSIHSRGLSIQSEQPLSAVPCFALHPQAIILVLKFLFGFPKKKLSDAKSTDAALSLRCSIESPRSPRMLRRQRRRLHLQRIRLKLKWRGSGGGRVCDLHHEQEIPNG